MKARTVAALVLSAVAFQVSANQPLYAQDASAVKVTELYKTSLKESPGKEARILQLEIVPGGHVGWHYHPGDACAYVQEGSMLLVPRGQSPVPMKEGDSGCVAPKAVHDDKNASQTAPVKFLVFFVTEKGRPFAVPVQ